MNTLSQTLTAHIFANSTEYENLKQQWRSLVNSKARHNLSAAHHLLYLALLGRDWRTAFTLPTNQTKIANGGFANWGLFRAVHQLHSQVFEPQLLETFDGHVRLSQLKEVRRLIPLSVAYAYCLSDFKLGHFPFAAYSVSQEWLTSDREADHA